MKAVRLHDYGTSKDLKYEEAPIPGINDNEILIRVYATSVNHLEIMKGGGEMKEKISLEFPWIPGQDFSGVVERTGKNISSFKEGDRVYGNCNGGSYAEFLVPDMDKVDLMPDNLNFLEAATVPHVGETAWQAIHIHGQLKKGQKVLIHGAAGAVGAFAVQFAHNIGAKVYGTASDKDIEYVKSLGADEVIDYATTDFSTAFKDMDLVLVLVGGDTQKKSYSVLKHGGRLVSTTGAILEDEAKKRNVTGIAMVIKQSAKDLQRISELIEAGKVKTDVAVTFDLKDAGNGWAMLTGEDPTLGRITHGKIVLQVLKEDGSKPKL